MTEDAELDGPPLIGSHRADALRFLRCRLSCLPDQGTASFTLGTLIFLSGSLKDFLFMSGTFDNWPLKLFQRLCDI